MTLYPVDRYDTGRTVEKTVYSIISKGDQP